MSDEPTPADLLRTIRQAIYDWAGVYEAASGHRVAPSYCASLANDIAFELGILEAIGAATLRDAEA